MRGNATKAAEIHQSEGKVPYADFTLAVSRTKDQTTFFPVRVFGKLGEACENVKKGIEVLVDGKLDILLNERSCHAMLRWLTRKP